MNVVDLTCIDKPIEGPNFNVYQLRTSNVLKFCINKFPEDKNIKSNL